LACQGIIFVWIIHRKVGDGDAVRQDMWIGGGPYWRHSDKPIGHAFFYDALCFDVIIRGVLMVPVINRP
jgi:hypothetical protein